MHVNVYNFWVGADRKEKAISEPKLFIFMLLNYWLTVNDLFLKQFLKSAWRHSVIDYMYYDKTRNTEAHSWSRHDVTAYMTITIKPKKLRILRLDIWGTVSVFIIDLNADIRGGFTNLTAD